MALERDRRKTAGRLMQRLLEEECDEDDFYKSTYGGFLEEEGDDNYLTEDDEEDVVDTDFSMDEEDEVKSDDEDESKPKWRKKTKIKIIQPQKPKTVQQKPRKIQSRDQDPKASPGPGSEERKRSFRSSTIKVAEAAERQHQQAKARTLQRHPRQPEMRRLTQEELLAEAKITEEQNLASLAAFLKLEAEKKKTKMQKVKYHGPVVRFQSLTMPLIDEFPEEPEIKVDDSMEIDVFYGSNQRDAKCSRNFLVFTDVKNFPKAYFPSNRVRVPEKPLCVVTGLPAVYRDPLTRLPYATLEAFKVIREKYKRKLQRKEVHRKEVQNETESKKRRKSVKELPASPVVRKE